MKQKPRHRDDHLVTRRMFNRAYFQIGMIQASAGFMTYFIVMADHGFFINDLFGLRGAWDGENYLIINRFGELWVCFTWPYFFIHLFSHDFLVF